MLWLSVNARHKGLMGRPHLKVGSSDHFHELFIAA
jgi:hypothetical protein